MNKDLISRAEFRRSLPSLRETQPTYVLPGLWEIRFSRRSLVQRFYAGITVGGASGMLEYTLHNPSDPYTFLAEDQEVAALVVGILSTAFGADTEDENEDNHIPIFILGGYNEWYQDRFSRTPEKGLEARKKAVGDALLSFMLGGFKDRDRYNAALDAIDDPAKRDAFMQKWQDGRTSLNDIGSEAHRIGRKLTEEPANEV